LIGREHGSTIVRCHWYLSLPEFLPEEFVKLKLDSMVGDPTMKLDAREGRQLKTGYAGKSWVPPYFFRASVSVICVLDTATPG